MLNAGAICFHVAAVAAGIMTFCMQNGCNSKIV